MAAQSPNSCESCVLAVRSSVGLLLRQGTSEEGIKIFNEPTKVLGNPEEVAANNTKPQLLFTRVCAFSPDGAYLAYCDSVRTVVIDTRSESKKEVFSKDLPKTTQIKFSPQSTYLLTFEPYYFGKDREEGTPNAKIWDLKSGECLSCFVSKKASGWAPRFSDDENLCVKLVGSELLLHSKENLNKYTKKHVIPKMADYSLSRGPAPYHVACYVPVAKGQPGMVRMLSCDNFGPVSSKTFWKADRVSMNWNSRGSAVIVMAITDVDSTGQSYYGEQNLYVLLTKGEGYMVALEKNGPVYQVDWSPSSNEFVVVYGYMPAKATLYNLKGDSIMDFGTGPRNEVHYNPFGNIVCICGFGNLRGNMEFWSTKDKKKISQIKAEDTTQFQWAPDGRHFVTATTAPRLRVNNGYKFWKYTGELICDVKFPQSRELWEVMWKPEPSGVFKDFQIDYHQAQTNRDVAKQENASQPGVNKDAVYVPPHLRNSANKPTPSQPPTGKKPSGHSQQQNKSQQPAPNALSAREKEVLKLQKKVKEIENLKVKRDSGAQLQQNQLEKIEKESELVAELESLKMG